MNKQNENDEDWAIGPHLKALWRPLAVCIAIASLPLLSGSYFGWSIDPGQAGVFGDFVGGYIGTIVFTLSVWILFVSYRNQKATNQQALSGQENAHKITIFESRLFELLRYHRENVQEIKVQKIEGRRTFVYFITEWRMALDIIKVENEDSQLGLSENDCAEIAYLVFLYGIGPNSTRLLASKVKAAFPNLQSTFINAIELRMQRDKEFYRGWKKSSPLNQDSHYEMGGGLILARDIRWLPYTPFDGHQTRLEHHYRHLYHLVKYAAEHAPSEEQAKDYIKLVRAQLSTHEQALLALQAALVEGVWKTCGYIEEFYMIKNLPEEFFLPSEFPLAKTFPKNYPPKPINGSALTAATTSMPSSAT